MPGVYIQEKPKATASMLKLGVSVQAVASEPARSIVQKLAAIETTNTGSRLTLRRGGHEKRLALTNSEDISLSLESEKMRPIRSIYSFTTRSLPMPSRGHKSMRGESAWMRIWTYM
jgi:hypothetical protein